MDNSKIGNNVPAPQKGDDGEAVLKNPKMTLRYPKMSQKCPMMLVGMWPW